jgi:subtilisin family serine protease
MRVGLAKHGPANTVLVQPNEDPSITIAVVDTGVDRTHPDINLVGGVDFTHDNDFGLDGNGHGTHVSKCLLGGRAPECVGGGFQKARTADCKSKAFCSFPRLWLRLLQPHWHLPPGPLSQVAGIIGARNNAIGVLGALPGELRGGDWGNALCSSQQ